MNKNELLANEINEEEIKQLQCRVDHNSLLINELTDKLVADYCRQLDNYIKFINDILNDEKNPPSAEEMDYWVMKLPIYYYFTGEAQENLGIKVDVAKAIKQEKYNEIYRGLSSGTISDKTSQAELACQSEEITRIVYDRAYKIVREKMDAAKELTTSIKKVISRRTAELELANVDEGRFSTRH